MNKKKAIVTGGSNGIGRGIVYALASEGYDVVFSYNSHEESAKNIEKELNTKYQSSYFNCESVNLAEKDAGVNFFKNAVKKMDGLDLFVNNAGVTICESIFDLTEDNLDYLFNLLFRNYLILMRESASYMASRHIRGNIINISSTRGISCHPKDAIYGAVKAGLNRAIKSVALDCAPYGIRVNNILPGAIQRFTSEELKIKKEDAHVKKIAFLSPRIPLERYGLAEDVANAVIFLASERASYITGISLPVDGGLSLPGLAETEEEAATGWGRTYQEIKYNLNN